MIVASGLTQYRGLEGVGHLHALAIHLAATASVGPLPSDGGVPGAATTLPGASSPVDIGRALCRTLRAADAEARLTQIPAVMKAFQKEVERLTQRAVAAEDACERAAAATATSPPPLSGGVCPAREIRRAATLAFAGEGCNVVVCGRRMDVLSAVCDEGEALDEVDALLADGRHG